MKITKKTIDIAVKEAEQRTRMECAEKLEKSLDLGLRVGMPKTYFMQIVNRWKEGKR